MSRLFHVHEFAELAGVTVKALHHYDRLGLLKPTRTDAGYRMYANADLERLEQILALKFLGFPLKQVRTILERTSLELAEALRWQRKAIEDTQAHLGRALQAIRAAEHAVDSGQPVDPAILKRIIEVINVQQDIELMKRYYSEEAWEGRRRYYEEGPSAEWQELYRDVHALIGTDPGSDQAQEVADRWLALAVRSYTGDPDVQTDSMTAWMDREQWPPAMKRRIEAFKLEEVTAFIKQAAVILPEAVLQPRGLGHVRGLEGPQSGRRVTRLAGPSRSLPRRGVGDRPRSGWRTGAGARGALASADGRQERGQPRRQSGADEAMGRPAALAAHAAMADGGSQPDVGRAV